MCKEFATNVEERINGGWRHRNDDCRIDIARESGPANAIRNRATLGVQSDVLLRDTEGSNARRQWEFQRP